MFRHIVSLLVIVLPMGLVMSADLPATLQQRAELVLRGVDDTVMRINSGICRIFGETRRSGGRVIQDDIMIAFDYHNHFYRFDNGERIRSLLTSEYYYEGWNLREHNPSVTRFSANEPKISDFANFVDIQGLFMFTPVGPRRHNSYQYFSLHKRLADATFNVIDYSEMSNGITTVSVTYPRKDGAPPNTIIFFVNTKNDYTVQHIEYGGVYVMDITWSQINNTWVPTAYVLKSNSDIGVEWRIEWESVNEKVDPKLFTVEDMVSDIKDAVPLFTRELGPAVHIGVVGADMPPFEFEYLNKKPSYWFSNTLFYLGCLFTLIALSKMIHDWWRKRNKKDP